MKQAQWKSVVQELQWGNIVHLYQNQMTDTHCNLWWGPLPFSSLVPVTDSSGIFGYGRGTAKRLSREADKWKGPGRLKDAPTQGKEASTDVVETCCHLGKSGMQHRSLLSHDLTVNLCFHGYFSGSLHPAINLWEIVNIYFKRKHVGTAKAMKCWTSSSAGIN